MAERILNVITLDHVTALALCSYTLFSIGAGISVIARGADGRSHDDLCVHRHVDAAVVVDLTFRVKGLAKETTKGG
jgi:hypothetical protein